MERYFDPLEHEDKILVCRDCQGQFWFSEGEQRFYFDRALAEPRRCPKCRQARRIELERRVIGQ